MSHKATKSILILIFFSLSSKFFGFIRELLIASKFGSGIDTDTFFIAISAINLFVIMITKAINNTLIPVLSEIEKVEGKKGKINHTNNLINVLIIISLILVIVGWLLSPYIIKILAAGFKGKQYKLAILMMRVGMPALLFASVQGVLRGFLQSELMFTEAAISDLPFNFVYILFLIFLADKFNIIALMVVSVLAVASKIIIQIPGIKSVGYRYNFTVNYKDNYIKKILHLMPPVLVSATVSDLNSIVDNSMASSLVEGSISSLQYAKRIEGIINGTFISAITTVFYPILSKEANNDAYHSLKKTTVLGVNIILLITLPATVGIIILAEPIVRIAFQRGAFGQLATYMTSGALIFYAVGIGANALKSMINSTYYALQDTKTPMRNSLITLIINILLNLILIKYMKHKGLALATSLSAIITLFHLIYVLKNKIGSFGFSKSLKCGLKSLFASLIMGVIVMFLNASPIININNGTVYELASLVISVGVGIIVYSILIYLFNIEEVKLLLNIVKQKFKRNR